MDGLKLLLQQSGDVYIQKRFYNGWTHDHYISCVFVFAPDGTIAICAYNLPVLFMIVRLRSGVVFIKN